MSKSLLFLIGLCVVGAAAGLMTDKPSVASTNSPPSMNPVPVTVTNTPLPITGTVGVSGRMTIANTLSAPVPVQTVAASAVTHVGQPATGHVTLVYLLGCRCYRRVDVDGTLEASAFSIPSEQVLMITDVDWSETGGASGGVAGRTASFLLLFGSTPVLQSEAAFNADLIAGNTEHLTGGRAFSSLPTPYGSNDFANIIISGYLVANN